MRLTPLKQLRAPPGAKNTRIIEHLAEGSTTEAGRKLVIPRLPYTRREADQILAIAPGADNLKALDFKANREVALGAELSQYRYVHFATHGLLDSERPGLSALALSMVDEQGKPQDGFLRAHEIYNLNLPAELVVLERVPDWTRQRDQRRRAGRADARVYVRRGGAGGGQFVECQ